jgi:SAM-dependent methyltransferase
VSAAPDPAAPRRRQCPICGSTERRTLFRQSFERLSGVEFLSGYDVVVCAACGLAYADGIPEQPVFDAYYRDLSKYEYQHTDGKESDLDERRFREIAATIAALLDSDRSARILEIGCATGRLLSLLRHAGFPDVEGLDPSPGCARAALQRYDVPVSVGSLFSAAPLDRPFDCVILIGVLEHIEDLSGAVERLRTLLGPGGQVYAEVPDAANLAGRPDAAYQEFSTEHINFFSTESLANLFRARGFDVVMTDRAVRQQHDNTLYPAAFGVFRKTAAPLPLVPDTTTEPGLRRYIDESAGIEARIRRVLAQVPREQPLVVWGTGTHTQRLLAIGAFADVRIAAFVDSNPKYHGRSLHGIPVIGPASLAARKEPILISTRGFQTEIQDQIRRQLKLDNQILLLYENA